MKAVVWAGINKIETRDLKLPEAKKYEVIIKVLYTSICDLDITIISISTPDNVRMGMNIYAKT